MRTIDDFARQAVASAVLGGRLPRPTTCEACGKAGSRFSPLHYHHWSYAEPHWLDVIPLCVGCHAKVHAGLIPEPRTGRVYISWRRTGLPTDADYEDFLNGWRGDR